MGESGIPKQISQGWWLFAIMGEFLSNATHLVGLSNVLQPIRIMPGAYKLFEAEVPGVTELCTAFKTQYNTKLEEQKKNIGRTPAGGRSVYAPPSMHRSAVQRGGATPAARLSGAATPSAGRFGGATPGISRFGPTPSGFAPQVANCELSSSFCHSNSAEANLRYFFAVPGGMTPRPCKRAHLMILHCARR